MTTRVPVSVPMSLFSDEQLAGLFAASTLWHTRGFEAIAVLTGEMARSEGQRRQHNRTHPEAIQSAGTGEIDASQWSDTDIADSLFFCWHCSEFTRDPKLGEFLDSLGDAFVSIACDRLRSSGDPRNASSFEDRLQETQRRDPSTN